MSIGAELLAARQAAGLSIDDVATSTRVRVTLIRYIEDDNFDPCGGAVYARGHIRNIAVAVGLDPEPLVAEFNKSIGTATAIPAHQMLEHTEIVQRSRNGPNWTAAMLVTAVLLVAVALYSLFTGPDSAPPTTAAAPISSAPVVAPQPEPAVRPGVDPSSEPAPAAPASTAVAPSQPTEGPAASQPTSPAPTAASSSAPVVAFNGVTVRVSITGEKCWVRATDLSNGKKVLLQRVLYRGEVQNFTAASKMSLQFGNAGAASLIVNGRNIGAPGAPGQVVTLPFGPGDPGAG